MTTAMLEPTATDSSLVTRALDGDRSAFAAVYDRYSDQLFNFAHSMLRNREDAADAVADAFVKFAERLSQLRDPEKLKAWLYAIVRTECLRRLRSRSRLTLGDDVLADVVDKAATPHEAVETAALRQLVWDAAAGLGERDRALLDLHLRQGLEAAELGEVFGVKVSHAHVMIDRLRKQMERSLGALLIAKTARNTCSDLDSSLANWDGSFSPLVRKRVARHVDRCAKCTLRRAAMVSPLALFAGVPAFAAPAGLRNRVLSESLSPTTGPSMWLRRGILGGAGAAILVVVSTVFAGQVSEGALEADSVERFDVPRHAVATQDETPEPSSEEPLVSNRSHVSAPLEDNPERTEHPHEPHGQANLLKPSSEMPPGSAGGTPQRQPDDGDSGEIPSRSPSADGSDSDEGGTSEDGADNREGDDTGDQSDSDRGSDNESGREDRDNAEE